MRAAAQLPLLVALLSVGSTMADDAVDCAGMKGKELRSWLMARGLECKGCSEKADFVDLCNANKDAPLKPPEDGKMRTPGVDEKKDVDIDELLKSMKGMPGMENLKMYTADDLKDPESMANAFGGGGGGGGRPRKAKPKKPKFSREEYRQQLVDFYNEYGLEHKLDGVDKALDKFAGREDQMMQKLHLKYQAEIAAKSEPKEEL